MKLISEWIFIVGAAAFAPASALAMPTLAEAIASAEDHAFDARTSAASVDRAEADRDEARSRLLPSFTATGTYAHNQYDAVATIPNSSGTGVRTATFVAHDQFDGTLALTIPIVDVASIVRLRARNASLDAARLEDEATRLVVTQRTVLAYYELAAAIALVESAERSETVARESLRVLGVRRTAGLSSDLDVARAEAEAERRAQLVSDAGRRRNDARRALELLMGSDVDATAIDLESTNDAEAPLETWIERAGALPLVRAADASAAAARSERAAARSALVPVISGALSERFTSAPGFGQQPSYQVLVRAAWTLDLGIAARSRSGAAAAEIAEIGSERIEAEARNAIASAWDRTESSRHRVAAATVALDAARRAVTIARVSREAGTTTQLELDQAERDALDAEVAQIDARASLAASRAELRVLAGETLR